MPLEDTLYKQILAQNAIKHLGKSLRNPHYRLGQLSDSDYQAALGKLPHGDSPEIQVMDSASANYGLFYFLVNFSTVGGPDIIP